MILLRHKLPSRYTEPDHFVFSTRTGGALRQFNVGRALRKAQRDAVNDDGNTTFPVLSEVDSAGRPVPVPHGSVPSMHSFRHTVASRALLAGGQHRRNRVPARAPGRQRHPCGVRARAC
jgi:integrase